MSGQPVAKWCRSGRQDVEKRSMDCSGWPSFSSTVTPFPLTHSPHLAPSDYFLFPRLEEHFSGRWFPSDSAVKTSAGTWLNGLGAEFYEERLNKLVLRANKFQNRLVDYVEKSGGVIMPRPAYIGYLPCFNIHCWTIAKDGSQIAM
ncbi:uncharacterized protein TNCV_782221 [Trichonephila clavipes]|nr:uncharacterized protein TNCV_782221 [Trichonephila clavipes]